MKLRFLVCVRVAMCIIACPQQPSGAQPEAKSGQAAPASRSQPAAAPEPAHDASQPQVSLVAEGRAMMGTWFELKVEQAGQEQVARSALTRALEEIARLEDVLSEWRPHTELSRINDSAGGAPISVGDDTLMVLQAGQRISQLSQGAFDLTWAALRGLYRFERDAEPVLPDPKLLRQQRALIAYRDLLVDAPARTARLKRAGMALGTGGIAKGYALDRAGQILQEAGFNNYLLFAGGQVQVHGSREGRAWRVGIKHPRRPDGHVGFFELHDGSVSTSGDYEHSYMVAGKRVHHIIDPRTGLPADKSASVTLVARRGMDADALSTACFVLGPQRCLAMLQKHGEGVEAVIIDPTMRVFMSPGMTGKVRFNPPLQAGRLPD